MIKRSRRGTEEIAKEHILGSVEHSERNISPEPINGTFAGNAENTAKTCALGPREAGLYREVGG